MFASSSGVDFDSLEVETTWISEEIDDKDVFVASDIDGKDWMDVYNSGIVMMKCLSDDSHRTELKEMTYTATVNKHPRKWSNNCSNS